MIHIKFKPVFDVEILHDYYKSGKSSDWVFIPTDACRIALRNFGLRFRSNDSGFIVFAETDTLLPNDVIKKPIADNTLFSFYAKLKNSDFVNFTQLNLNQNAGVFYYFNNLVNNLNAENKPLLVANTINKNAGDDDRLKKTGPLYAFHHTEAAATQTGEIRMHDNNQKLLQVLENNNNNFDFSFQTNPLPEGRASFFIEGVKHDEFYILKNSNDDFFALIEIFHRNSFNTDYLFQNNQNEIVTKNYKIKFAARKTTWRYIVSNKFGNTLPDAGVKKTNGVALSFTKDNAAPDDKLIFFSDNELPLKEEPVAGIKLLKNKNDNNSALIENLPNPSTRLIQKLKNDPKIYSDIFITI